MYIVLWRNKSDEPTDWHIWNDWIVTDQDRALKEAQ